MFYKIYSINYLRLIVIGFLFAYIKSHFKKLFKVVSILPIISPPPVVITTLSFAFISFLIFIIGYLKKGEDLKSN
jgi:ABC-type molybdate transport system permease subunit